MAKIEIDEGTLAIIRETARQTAEEVIQRHRDSCPVGDMKVDFYGGLEGGLKGKVNSLDRRVENIEGRGSWFANILSSVLSSGLTGFVCWLLFVYAKK
jgi:hypothetical protein